MTKADILHSGLNHSDSHMMPTNRGIHVLINCKALTQILLDSSVSPLILTSNFQWTKAYCIQKVAYDGRYPCWHVVWSQLSRENDIQVWIQVLHRCGTLTRDYIFEQFGSLYNHDALMCQWQNAPIFDILQDEYELIIWCRDIVNYGTLKRENKN